MGAFFEDLPELLRTNTNGEVDVDDFFYLTMVQWAKLTAITIEKSTHKVAWVEKHNPAARAATAALALATDAALMGDANNNNANTNTTTTLVKTSSALSITSTPFAASSSSSALALTSGTGTAAGTAGHQSYHTQFLKQFVESMHFTPLPGEGK